MHDIFFNYSAPVHLFHCRVTNLFASKAASKWVKSISSFDEVVFFSSTLTDFSFITTWPFLWKVSTVTLVSCLPLYIIKYLKRKFSPPSYSKLSSWFKHGLPQFSLYFSEHSYIYSTFVFKHAEWRWTCRNEKALKEQERNGIIVFIDRDNNLRRKNSTWKRWKSVSCTKQVEEYYSSKAWNTWPHSFCWQKVKCLPFCWHFKKKIALSVMLTRWCISLQVFICTLFFMCCIFLFEVYSFIVFNCSKGIHM